MRAVLGNVERPADAYLVFRLGEMSGKPPEYVMKHYKSGKVKDWGELAKSLGIKPGSKEFHALKAGHDLRDDKGRGKEEREGRDNGKWEGKGKNRGRDKDRGKSECEGKGKGKG